MNKFTRNLQTERPVSRQSSPGGKPWILRLILNCAIMILLVFAAFVLRVRLNEKIDVLNLEAETIRRQIREKELEVQNLKNKREELSTRKYVNTKIKEYNLALREPEYFQVKYIERQFFTQPNPGVKSSAVAASGRRDTEAAGEGGARYSGIY